MIKVGFVGWRGMVGSVLMARMLEEDDFAHFEPHFFSSSQAGQKVPKDLHKSALLKDAFKLEDLSTMDVIISCQGSSYTSAIYNKLRSHSWKGYWVDAASELRMDPNSCLVLDPVNSKQIEEALDGSIKTFVGANCTVSLMLMAIGKLLREGLVEWIHVNTYQAISGAGAAALKELLLQMNELTKTIDKNVSFNDDILSFDAKIRKALSEDSFSTKHIGSILNLNILPWIDAECGEESKEEWKGFAETNELLALNKSVAVQGTCVRVPVLRSHSQSIMLKLNKNISIEEFTAFISSSNEWVRLVENKREDTLSYLNPLHVSGGLDIYVGRIRKLTLDENMFSLFTVGDQLLWGAAEPLRRILLIILKRLSQK